MTTDVQADQGRTAATASPLFPSQAAASRMLLRYEVRRAERGRAVVDGEPATRRPATAGAGGGSAVAASDRIVPD